MPENEESLKTYRTAGIEKLANHFKIVLQSQGCIVSKVMKKEKKEQHDPCNSERERESKQTHIQTFAI